jgi:hypothetical protein
MAVSRRCYHCHTRLERGAGQPVTVDADGTYRRWTPERAAYFARFGQRAHVVSLCPACHALEPAEAAQASSESEG